ncbi:MAG TPA: aspartate kinase [Firmicutes bacterium]|nr:aspartate kinase [Bacillota bacterium]
MHLVIQKFGGSSLATPQKRQQAVEHIIRAKEAGAQVVVVVSAMGRRGDPYATDTLLAFYQEAGGKELPREADLLLSCGEVISAAVMASAIAGCGHAAVALTGTQAGIVTDGVFGSAEIVRISKENICRRLQDNQIVVVTGFQGITPEGEITTLGRGGSDITAVALGVALEAEVVEIYSDVDAVMTADPQLVPEARPITDLGYHEVLQMAREGAKVLHPRAVDLALRYNVPLLLKKTGSSKPGTLVSHQKAEGFRAYTARQNVVTGITHVTGLAQVRLPAADMTDLQVEEVLQELSAANISIDLISLSPGEKMFTITARDAEKAQSIINKLGFKAAVAGGFAKVTLVGAGMRGVPGVMARILSALNKAGTTVMQTADSHLNISCLIPEKDVSKAVRALHSEFSGTVAANGDGDSALQEESENLV